MENHWDVSARFTALTVKFLAFFASPDPSHAVDVSPVISK
jgi:hypothetical protein